MNSIKDQPGEINNSDWQRYLDLVYINPELIPEVNQGQEPASDDVRQSGIVERGSAIFPDVFF